jgi:putative cardiolipin synthase
MAIRTGLSREARMASCVRTLPTILLLLAAGCASLPKSPERVPTAAFDQPETTSVGAVVAQTATQHPGSSGFALLSDARKAFEARVFFTVLAERSLDLQYYIWESDTTGRVLAERLIRAADRGVRVRLLVDDNNLAGRDPVVAALDAHPLIEVRIFNPFAHRTSHALDFAVDFGRVNHRMHNKILIADSAVAVVGGRNIGDDYFGLSPEADFRDLDVAAAGPIARDIAAGFDGFWNSDWAWPISSLVKKQATAADLGALRSSVRERLAASPYPYPHDDDVAALKGRLGELVSNLVWAPGEVLADDPNELTSGERGDLGNALAERMNAAEREILIESAYFVQRKPAVEAARRVCASGVRIRVLTNSLASNDVAPAHAGYEKHRKELVEAGVELYELRPDAAVVREQLAPEAAGAVASLHTKAVVFDRESVFIGSFNLDPRSADLNTEVGLLIESPELAAETAAYFDEAVAPESSFHVQLDGDGDLVWISEVDGVETRWGHEPDTSGWQRFVADVIKLLPIQSQL